MPKSLATVSALVAAMTLVMTQACAAGERLDVHEWGTFTSIAGSDGISTGWLALGGPNDLPCFVNRLENNGSLKAGLIGTVRMETPVLYFYTQRDLTITAEARFPQGLITEWYPRAEVTPSSGGMAEGPRQLRDGSITWSNVSITPNEAPILVADGNASHYYAARAVEAVPLRVSNQQEKFLFYRGVGNFALSISARTLENRAVAVDNLTDDAVDWLVFFEKRGSKIGYHIYGGLRARQRLTIETPPLDGDAVRLRAEIEGRLIDQRLYPSEAKAMVETWRDAWFEEGARVLYLVPRSAVDTVLPLSITPSPDEIVRVFMGRLEVITPATQQAVVRAISRHWLATHALSHPSCSASPPTVSISSTKFGSIAFSQLPMRPPRHDRSAVGLPSRKCVPRIPSPGPGHARTDLLRASALCSGSETDCRSSAIRDLGRAVDRRSWRASLDDGTLRGRRS